MNRRSIILSIAIIALVIGIILLPAIENDEPTEGNTAEAQQAPDETIYSRLLGPTTDEISLMRAIKACYDTCRIYSASDGTPYIRLISQAEDDLLCKDMPYDINEGNIMWAVDHLKCRDDAQCDVYLKRSCFGRVNLIVVDANGTRAVARMEVDTSKI